MSGVSEDDVEADSAAEFALVLARRKANAVAADVSGPALVVGCDSVLELDGAIYGKPASPDEAVANWRRMRGRAGVLHSGHCVIDTSSGKSVGETASTVVHFADVTDAEIAAYVATGEPLHVAGAFKIDGLGGAFVERIDGDHHAIVGLSLPLLRRLVGELGVFWPSLWNLGPR